MQPHRHILLTCTLLSALAVLLRADDEPAADLRVQSPKLALKLVGKDDSDHGRSSLGLTVVGNYAYVTVWDYGLHVFDVSNPAAPKKVGACSLPGTARDVAVVGKYAYVAAREGGLRVVDISNPKVPTDRGSYRPQRTADWGPIVEAVAVVGQYAYVAYKYRHKNKPHGGVHIVDISNPKAPAGLGSFETVGQFESIAVAGKYAYVADNGNDGILYIVAISNPRAPFRVGSCEGLGEPQGVVVAGNYAYVADDADAMYIVDVSNPKAPKTVGSFTKRPGLAEAVAVAGRYAYVCDNGGGRVYVVDISDPTAPREVAFFETTGVTAGVAVAGEYVYVNVWPGRLFILRPTTLADDKAKKSGESEEPGPAAAAEKAVREALAAFEKGWKPRLLTLEHNPPTWQLLDAPSWKLRMETLVGLVKAGPAATPVLVEALKKGAPATRELAAHALAIRADPGARPALLRALEDPEVTVRMYAVRALSTLGGQELTERQRQFLPVHGFVGRYVGATLSRDKQPHSAAIRQALVDFDLASIDTARLGMVAPDFTLTDALGDTYRLSQFHGKKVVVLEFSPGYD